MSSIARIAAGALGAVAVALGAVWFHWLRMPPFPPPILDGDMTKGSLSVGPLVRRYRIYRPGKIAPAPPLVFVLHGSMSDGSTARRTTYYEFDRLADRHGFLVIYPDGYEQHWNDCRAAGPYSANTQNIDDVAFIAAMIDYFVAEESVNPERVYAAGISNGGQMAYRLALELPDRVAAVAAVAASLPDDANLDCAKSGKPMATLIVNGTADPMNPYTGGTVALYGIFRNTGTVLSTDDTVAYFAGLAGHRGPPRVNAFPDAATDDDSRAELRTWSDGPGPPVALLAIEGGGHTFPHLRHRFPRFLGPTNADVDAAAEIWRFFSGARRRQARAGASAGAR
jgi:polyhydroxybutyrate depolymerase